MKDYERVTFVKVPQVGGGSILCLGLKQNDPESVDGEMGDVVVSRIAGL